MKFHLVLFLTLLVFTGCSSPLLRPATTVIAGGAGAAGGSILGDGRPAPAALGSMLGTAASETFFGLKSGAEKKAHRAGYEQALGDQARSEYWRLQQQHLPDAPPVLRLPVPLPGRVAPDGVRIQPTTQFIEIHQ